MLITKKWLEERVACPEGVELFIENCHDGIHRDDVLRLLDEAGEYDYYSWLLEKTLKECPLPEGMTALPDRLHRLYLGGGSLPEGMTTLPDGLRRLSLGGGTLPDDMTTLPDGLELIYLCGGSLPKGIVVPRVCQVY